MKTSLTSHLRLRAGDVQCLQSAKAKHRCLPCDESDTARSGTSAAKLAASLCHFVIARSHRGLHMYGPVSHLWGPSPALLRSAPSLVALDEWLSAARAMASNGFLFQTLGKRTIPTSQSHMHTHLGARRPACICEAGGLQMRQHRLQSVLEAHLAERRYSTRILLHGNRHDAAGSLSDHYAPPKPRMSRAHHPWLRESEPNKDESVQLDPVGLSFLLPPSPASLLHPHTLTQSEHGPMAGSLLLSLRVGSSMVLPCTPARHIAFNPRRLPRSWL